jgi:hypothetical protein
LDDCVRFYKFFEWFPGSQVCNPKADETKRLIRSIF